MNLMDIVKSREVTEEKEIVSLMLELRRARRTPSVRGRGKIKKAIVDAPTLNMDKIGPKLAKALLEQLGGEI